MKDTENFFFELIKIAVGYQNSFSKSPTANEWKEIYLLAKQQTLVGILLAAIEKLPTEQRPPKPLLMQWFAFSENIRMRNAQVNADAVKICEIVRKDGMRCVVLKGQGIAMYYPEPSLRQCGDIDLWIEGGEKKVLKYLRSKGEVSRILYTHADCEMPVSTDVELHYNAAMFYNPLYLYRLRKYLASQHDLFDNYIELPDNMGKLYIPTIEFNRYYILLHIYHHYFTEGIGLRQILDYYYVLQKGGTEESKQRTIKLFKQTGMWKFVRASMWVMKEVFGMEDKYLLCTPHEKAGKQLLDEIMLAGNFGKYDARINRNNHHKLLPRVWSSIKRKIRFTIDYPQEILFDIPMRAYMYIWRHFI